MRTFFILLFFALSAHAQQERVAILNTVDDLDSIGFSSLSYLTNKLRETAVNILPKSSYGVMTTESIVAFFSSQEQAIKVCRESTCLAELGRKVSADYVAQARIGRFEEQLSINFDLYKTATGNLIGSFTGNSKDMPGLLAIADEKAPVLFRQMIEDSKPKKKDSEFDYLLKREKAKEAAESSSDGSKFGGLDELGWRGWTRILTFTAATICGTLAVVNHLNAAEYKDRYNAINRTKPDMQSSVYYAWYIDNYDSLKNYRGKFRDSESYRNIYVTAAGVFAVAGALTFIF